MNNFIHFIFILFYEISKYGFSCQEAPKLNSFSFPSDLTIGSRARFLCGTYLGDSPLKFHWLKDDQNLPSAIVKQIDEVTSELIIHPLSLDNIGNYTCIVSNSFGSDRVTAELLVKASPEWVLQPRDSKVMVGGSIAIDCKAKGSPEVHISWKKEDSLVTGSSPVATSKNLKIASNYSLIITNAQKSEDGVYICEASNGIGVGLQQVMRLIVYEYPVVHKVIDHITIERGQAASLSCNAKGDRPLFFSWAKNKKLITELPDMSDRISFSEDNESDSLKFTLKITETVIGDEGLYTCSAKNEFGTDENNIRLLLVERPNSPNALEVVDIWSKSARIKWVAPSNGNSPILRYIVEYWTLTGGHQNETVSSSTTMCILRNLNPFSKYHFRVWAANTVGVSDPSQEEQFTTAKEEPSAPPMDIRIETTGSTFVRLSWKPPPVSEWNGGLSGYYIGYKQASSSHPYTFNTVEVDDDTVYCIVRGLQKAKRYLFIVKAYNEIGSGPSSEEISFRTHNQDPPPQPTLMIKSIASTHLQVEWFLPEEMKSQITGYMLHYRKNYGKWKEIFVPEPSQVSFTLTNLEVGETYQIFVASHSGFGISEPSEIATIRTSMESLVHSASVPPAPHRPSVDDVTQTLYVVVPIAVATVIIVIVVVTACVYVYAKRPLPNPYPYADVTPDKSFCYMSTAPRRRDPPIPLCVDTSVKQRSPYTTVPLTRPNPEEEEPIYESVVEEIRYKIMQRNLDEEKKIGSGTIV